MKIRSPIKFQKPIIWNKREILWWKQRRKWGFDEREIWNLDVTIAQFIIPRLQLFIQSENPDKKTKKDLESILEAFKIITSGNWEYQHQNQKKIDRGLKLFAEYFQALWM